MNAGDLAVDLDLDSPYPGPATFREDQSAFFFGRDSEKRALYDLLRRERTVVLFGKSGTGKSSLLRAGVFGRLRAVEHLPILVRFSFAQGVPPLAKQIRASIQEAIVAAGIDAEPPSDRATLWEYFHRTPFWDAKSALVTPVLVFDQFEEVFTLGRRAPGLPEALTEIADLAENRVPSALLDAEGEGVLPPGWRRPKVRLLFAIREDYLPQLEDLSSQMPCLRHNRYHLTELSGTNAFEAVTLGGKAIHVVPERAREIVVAASGTAADDRASLLPGDRRSTPPLSSPSPAEGAPEDLAAIEVHPALLSMFCWELNEQRKTAKADQISREQVRLSEDIFIHFYERSLEGLPKKVVRFIEGRLVDAGGRRTSISIEDTRSALGESAGDEGVDKRILRPLVERRILSLEPRYGTVHVELVHDKLAKVVRNAAGRRQEHTKRLAAFGVAVCLLAAATGGVTFGIVRAAKQIAAHDSPILSPAKDPKEDSAKDDALLRWAQQSLASARAEPDPARAAAILARLAKQARLARWEVPLEVRREMAREVARRPVTRDLGAIQDEIQTLAASPTGQEVATVSASGKVRVWRLDTGASSELGFGLSSDLESGAGLRYSPSGKARALGAAKWLSVWRDGSDLPEHEISSYPIVDLAFTSEAGPLLVLQKGGSLALECDDVSACEGDVSIESAQPAKGQARWLRGALSPDARWLVHAYASGVVRWWQVGETKRAAGRWVLPAPRQAGCLVVRSPARDPGVVPNAGAPSGAASAPTCAAPGGSEEAPIAALAIAGDRLFIGHERHVFTVDLTKSGAGADLLTPSFDAGEIDSLAATKGAGVVATSSSGALRRWDDACLEQKLTDAPGAECSESWSWSSADQRMLAVPLPRPAQGGGEPPSVRVVAAADGHVRLWTFGRPPPPEDWTSLSAAVDALSNVCLPPSTTTGLLGLSGEDAEREYKECLSSATAPAAAAPRADAPPSSAATGASGRTEPVAAPPTTAVSSPPDASGAPARTASGAPSSADVTSSLPSSAPPVVTASVPILETPGDLGSAGGVAPPSQAAPRLAFQTLASAKKLPLSLPTGESVHRFTLSLKVPEGISGQIKRVTWETNHPTFKQRIREGKPPTYAVSWDGWGCLRTVILRVETTDGATQTTRFDMCKALGW